MSKVLLTRRWFSLLVGSALVVAGLVSSASPAASNSAGPFPGNFNPETAAGFTNTFSTIGSLQPQCPNALAGTPGSDPANKVLNQALNTSASFLAGGVVHYTYSDDPHTNPGTNNFTIQDCEVVYPVGFFSKTMVDPATGLVSGVSKVQLDSGGTPIDGASLSGILSPTGLIYFSWTVPSTVTAGQWVCNFARDIANNHGGDGNRKVTPTCFQVGTPQNPNVPNTPTVFVAYADGVHSGGGPRPTPWNGSPSTIFVGCDPATMTATCPLIDSGAVMITNTNTGPGGSAGGDPITVSNVTVTIGSCVFAPWPGLNQSVPAGSSLILTQTGTPVAPSPTNCSLAFSAGNLYNFDTSEEPGETPSMFSCTNNGLKATITMSVQNTTTATSITTSQQIIDQTQILNTGGIDVGDCTGTTGGVEAHTWVEVL